MSRHCSNPRARRETDDEKSSSASAHVSGGDLSGHRDVVEMYEAPADHLRAVAQIEQFPRWVPYWNSCTGNPLGTDVGMSERRRSGWASGSVSDFPTKSTS